MRMTARESYTLKTEVDKETKIEAFYCEMTGIEEPIWTYYEACGWHRGYFGMQVNSPTERRIIFSVWDSGGESRDRKNVGEEDRVKLVAKGEGVHTNAFGGEGTGSTSARGSGVGSGHRNPRARRRWSDAPRP